MSIDKITSKILSDAEASAKEVTDEAKAASDAILEEAKKKADELTKNAVEKGATEKEKLITRRRAVADIDGRKIILDQKQQLIAECFDKAVGKITSMDKEKYVDFLAGIVKKTGVSEGELIMNPKESAEIGPALVARLKEIMPVAAREASIYTGITIAEYFRDMGYSVALMADSTSRWAEALREMSGRLEEMPGEEGYPAYLGSRLAQFYERAGRVVSLGSEGRIGALSAIGAVSPPGGDISEPVSQATLRIVKVFWSLDASLAYARHFPAINWLQSYSLYVDRLTKWYEENVSKDFPELRMDTIRLLQEEAELQEIVQLVGVDALSFADRIKLEACKSIREDYLHQNAFHDIDTYSSMNKQYKLLKLIMGYYELASDAIAKGAPFNQLAGLPVRETIGRFKYIEEENIDASYEEIFAELRKEVADLVSKEAEDDD